MRRFYITFAAALLTFQLANAATVYDTLYLNAGMMLAVDSSTFPYKAFNHTSTFDQKNAVIEVQPNDQLIITIINNDTLDHAWFVSEYSALAKFLPTGDSINDTLTFTSEGLHILYNHMDDPVGRYMGGAGMIWVRSSTGDGAFFWNLREQDSTWNADLGAGDTVNWALNHPDYFLVNGHGRPGIANDPSAVVTGSVGDTIYINIANTGRSVHSLHFHGYHCTVVQSNNPLMIGRDKDTFPVWPMETMVLRMVPHQAGQFPVHEHNLLAVAGGGIYPNGIFLIMNIQ